MFKFLFFLFCMLLHKGPFTGRELGFAYKINLYQDVRV